MPDTFVVGLDLATSAGVAILRRCEGVEDALVTADSVTRAGPIKGFGPYPWSFVNAAKSHARQIMMWIRQKLPLDSDVVFVIEETNKTKGSRYAQKYLEYLHFNVLECIGEWERQAVYLSSSAWRSTLKISLSKDEVKANRKLKKLKEQSFPKEAFALAKKAAGILGKANLKHVAVRYANQRWGLELKKGDDDTAEALCLAEAYILGATRCDGT